jgi:hypothetical protein
VPQRQGELEVRRRQVFAAHVEQMFQRRGAEAPIPLSRLSTGSPVWPLR